MGYFANIKPLYLGLTLVGDEDSDLEDFFVGELEGEICSTIRTIPGIYPVINVYICFQRKDIDFKQYI